MNGDRRDAALWRGRLEFTSLAEGEAREILTWCYLGVLARYNFDTSDPVSEAEELRDLLDPANRYFAGRDAGGDLIGFCCFGPDARVPGGDYREPALDIGLGLRPDLVGRGHGGAFVEEILGLARRELSSSLLRLTVATFNRPAIRVYERAGFRVIGRFGRAAPTRSGPVDGFLLMTQTT